MVDVALPALALGYAIGRIGCLLVGDDYGRPTDLPWGVTFPVGLPRDHRGGKPARHGSERARSLGLDPGRSDAADRVHPTQIYETAMALAIWGVGMWLLKRRLPVGQRGLVVLALLAVERFLVEFLRAKDDRFFAGFTAGPGASPWRSSPSLWCWRSAGRAPAPAAPRPA